MAMNHTVMGIPKPPLPEIRSLLMDKRKVPIGWPACLKRSPPKATFSNIDIYVKSTESGENLYMRIPKKVRLTKEEQEPKEKNMRVFYKLNVNDNTNITSKPLRRRNLMIKIMKQ